MSDSDNDVIDTAAAVSDVVAAHAATQGVVMGEAAFGTTAATQRTVCGPRRRFETAVRVGRVIR